MTEKNKQIVTDWIEKKLHGQGNPMDDLDPSVVFCIPGSNTNPIFGKFTGIEEVERFFGLLIGKLSQKNLTQTIKVVNCLAEGQQVVAIVEEVFSSAKSNLAEPHISHGAWLFELNDESKITSLYCYDNTEVTSKALD
ncbi:hypothetical protein NG791_27350 [Laspinema sp. D1]|uniref:nuclear transport factor 2 family protein n=1 Tax=Laspinema palackyanum TaxID=3231601 RepID=UPI00348940CB|nr:hypothetical protein [Laspinema sp. D2b]